MNAYFEEYEKLLQEEDDLHLSLLAEMTFLRQPRDEDDEKELLPRTNWKLNRSITE